MRRQRHFPEQHLMKEIEFVHQNREKWRHYETLRLSFQKIAPDELARLYLDVTTDLVFAQTHYPESRLTLYLENLALVFHQRLYGRRSGRWRELGRFLFREVPSAFRESRRELLVSLFIFCFAVVVGIVSQCGEPEFARFVLGDQYVEMTLQNIAEGKPMAVYDNEAPMEMFAHIWLNNTLVDLKVFSAGLLTVLMVGVVVISNGVMVGCFETFLAQNGSLLEALFVVNMHGSLELPTIVLSGAAGLALGTGWVFPGERSRWSAFRDGAKRGTKMLLGTLPITFLAAVIESFVTRYANLPLLARIAFVVAGFLLVIYYVVVLPQQLSHHDTAFSDSSAG